MAYEVRTKRILQINQCECHVHRSEVIGMKILQVIPYFHPAYAFGGPVKVAYQIARELVKRKHEVVIYTSDAKDLSSRLSSDPVEVVDGIRVHYFRNLALMPIEKSKLFITPQIIPSVRKEVKKFDIIHLHEYRTFQNIIAHHYARKYDVPYVLQAHGSLSRMMVKRRLKWLYDVFFGYRLLSDASKVISLSRVEAEQYMGIGVPLEKITVIPNGIDLSECDYLPPKGSFRRKLFIDDDERIVLYLGRIHQSKGLDLLAEAFSVVLKHLSNARLVIVGPDDGYAATFSKLLSDLGIEESVLLTGFVKEKEKLSALLDSDVFVTPNFSGFPATFLEACITGTPIITTTKADELGWIHDNVGLVVEYSPMKLAEAITFILINREIAEKIGDKAKRFVLNEFSLEKTIGKLEKLYENVIKR